MSTSQNNEVRNAAYYGYSGQDENLGFEEEPKKEEKAKAPANSVRTNKLRRKGEAILQDKNLTTEEKQIQALRKRRKYDRSVQRDADQNKRDIERGQIRVDRDNRRIERMANRNQISIGEATKIYKDRQEALSGFKKGTRPPHPSLVEMENQNKKEATNKSNQQKLDEQNVDNSPWNIKSTLSKNTSQTKFL
tara:strand:- start:1562 stop:2137 length:576 start_codon:yes stop_codon:yes gene_type:complete